MTVCHSNIEELPMAMNSLAELKPGIAHLGIDERKPKTKTQGCISVQACTDLAVSGPSH